MQVAQIEARMPIFFDPSHKRRTLLRFLIIATLATAITWLTVFGIGLYFVQKLPSIDQAAHHDATARLTVPERPVTASLCGLSSAFSLTAHVAGWPDWGMQVLADCPVAAGVFEQWHTIDPRDLHLSQIDGTQGQDETLRNLLPTSIARWGVVDLPIISDFNDPTALLRLANNMRDLATENQYEGFCLRPARGGDVAFNALISEALAAISANFAKSCLIVEADSSYWQTPALIEAADRVVLLAYHTAANVSGGALAPQDWFADIIAQALGSIDAKKLTIGLGSFSVDRSLDGAQSETIPYAEAMRRAVVFGGEISLPADSLNTEIAYTDTNGQAHLINVLDGVSLYNQLQVLNENDLTDIAIFTVGLEDPSIWPLLSNAAEDSIRYLMDEISLLDYVSYQGKGPFREVLATAQPGQRLVETAPNGGPIISQTYTQIPQPYEVMRFGATNDRRIAITFDDGPDTTYTRDILDILRAESAPAAFFVVGSNALLNPDLLQRMHDEGHEIGTHTFFHADTAQVDDLRLRLEINVTQRLISSIIGHQAVMFRSPYGIGSGPVNATEARSVVVLHQSGYLVVGADIVPPDWQNQSAEALAQFVSDTVKTTGGTVIALHDAGGNRSQTVLALPEIIKNLRADGYEIVSLAHLLGVDQAQLMPPVTGATVWFDWLSFRFFSVVVQIIIVVFWVVIALGFVRAAALLMFALLRRPAPLEDINYQPSVCVIQAAYNEENVIVQSIESILMSDYPDLKLIVVDDGSSDQTFARIQASYGSNPRVQVIRQTNTGKWMALDRAYSEIDAEIVVAVDADTKLAPDAIPKMVRHFADPKIGAVAGNVKVANRNNLLTGLQALEYIVAQNIDRRAAEYLNAIMVVPGAIGAWRNAAVRKAGLYTNQTLAEDADLTIAIHRAGYRVGYEEAAFAYTNAPMRLRSFMRQRLRWSFGMMQTAWKHRAAAREGRAVGMIAIPDLLIIGVLMGLLAPLADLVFFMAVVNTSVNLLSSQPMMDGPFSGITLLGYLLLPVFDIIIAFTAFGYERKETKRLLFLAPLQRFIYRPLLYISIYRASIYALFGRVVVWGKQRPKATVDFKKPDSRSL